MSVRVGPDLRTGREVVGERVGGVFELLRDEAAENFAGEFLGLFNRALHAGRAGRKDDFGAVGLEQHAALDAHRLGHREDGAIAAGGGNAREPDARVARGGLDDDGARTDEAGLFRFEDHLARGAVLDAPGGIEGLDLGDDVRLEAVEPHPVVELQKRRAADKFKARLMNHDVSPVRVWSCRCAAGSLSGVRRCLPDGCPPAPLSREERRPAPENTRPAGVRIIPE